MFRAACPARKVSPVFRRATNFRRQAVPQIHNLQHVFPHPFPRAVPKVFLFLDGREILPARSSTHLKSRPAFLATRPYPLHRNEHIFRAYKATNTPAVRAVPEFSSVSRHSAEPLHIPRGFAQLPAPDQRRYFSRKSAKVADD